MNAVKRVLREVYGLFVDDAGYALSILTWLSAVWLLVRYLHLTNLLKATILVAGLAEVFIASAIRFARRNAPRI